MLRRSKKKRIREDSQEHYCLGPGTDNRSRILVLVFINWNLYKKKNVFGFSYQRVRGFGS